ncbi:MAG: hypothetical protein K0S25_916 [Bacillus sp. (in: firmicutes)]|jgi:hypothetical protein|nr:hypothetical protein [Bacillus sp. (in: firmicutes)]
MKLCYLSKISYICLAIFLFAYPSQVANGSTINIEQKPIPPYAKWGRLAMKETKTRYPKAEIVDYLHIGRITKPDETIEKFKLWLIEDNKEFGVYITIEFETKTEKIKKISFKETTK